VSNAPHYSEQNTLAGYGCGLMAIIGLLALALVIVAALVLLIQ
jgi:hypothetical protein